MNWYEAEALVLVTVLGVYFLDRWEQKYLKKLFDWVPAVLLAYVIPALVSYVLKVDYSAHSIHSFSKLFFIPLAIVAVMSSLSFAQLKAIGFKPIILFFFGSAIIALAPVVFTGFFLGSDFVQNTLISQGYWKGIPPIVGSWIGGSTSQLVLKELVQTEESLFLQVLVMDTVLVNIWTILMFQTIKKSSALNRFFKVEDVAMPLPIVTRKGKALSGFWVVLILVAAVLAVDFFAPPFVAKVLLLSLIGLGISNFIPTWNFKFVLRLGGILIIVVMAVLGLKLQIDHFSVQPAFLVFLCGWLFLHFIGMLWVAKLLNLHLAWVPIASMANVGGIATAPAVTAAYEKKWMPHAIVLAILSMATGTFWGMGTIWLFEILFGL